MSAIDAKSLAYLAMFPLPDVVLFPGTVLPLHIFEPRYREMARDVLAGDRFLAIARLQPGYEADYEGRPAVFETAGIGVIVADDELDDGRFNLIVQGIGRVAIEEEHPPEQSYRRVRARWLGDAVTSRPELVIGMHGQVLSVCKRLAEVMGEPGDQLQELAHAATEPSACADVLAAAILTNADDRQAMLEALDPADRLDTVLERVSLLLAKLAPETGLN